MRALADPWAATLGRWSAAGLARELALGPAAVSGPAPVFAWIRLLAPAPVAGPAPAWGEPVPAWAPSRRRREDRSSRQDISARLLPDDEGHGKTQRPNQKHGQITEDQVVLFRLARSMPRISPGSLASGGQKCG